MGENLQRCSASFPALLSPSPPIVEAIRVHPFETPEAPIEPRADKLCMLRVFRNYVDNAFKYGGERLSRIKIGHENKDGFHVFNVTDNGTGISEEDSRKVFELFHRNGTSGGVEGAGLGLAIAKEIAERHGGGVWVEPNPDRRTIFYVSISNNL